MYKAKDAVILKGKAEPNPSGAILNKNIMAQMQESFTIIPLANKPSAINS